MQKLGYLHSFRMVACQAARGAPARRVGSNSKPQSSKGVLSNLREAAPTVVRSCPVTHYVGVLKINTARHRPWTSRGSLRLSTALHLGNISTQVTPCSAACRVCILVEQQRPVLN